MRNDRKKPDTPPRDAISDGDARPDMQGEEVQKVKPKREKHEKDFSSNRAADVNSLEDYKDKKGD